MKTIYLYNEDGHFLWDVQDDGNSYPNSTDKQPDKKFVEDHDFDVVFNKGTREWEYINKKPPESDTLETKEPTEEEIKSQEEEMKKAQQEYLRNLASELYPYFKEIEKTQKKTRGKNAN